MKSLQEVLDNYSEYKVFLDDRFGKRLCDFLTNEQALKIGFKFKEGYINNPKEWTEENVIEQLKKDVEFGWEKCCDQRGISSGIMYDLVKDWCKVLENGLENTEYGYYGDKLFKAVADRYDIKLKDPS